MFPALKTAKAKKSKTSAQANPVRPSAKMVATKHRKLTFVSAAPKKPTPQKA